MLALTELGRTEARRALAKILAEHYPDTRWVETDSDEIRKGDRADLLPGPREPIGEIPAANEPDPVADLDPPLPDRSNDDSVKDSTEDLPFFHW